MPPDVIEDWPPLSTGKTALTPDGSLWLYQPNTPGGVLPTMPPPAAIEDYPAATTTGLGIDPDGTVWLYHPPSGGMIDLTPIPPAPVNQTPPVIAGDSVAGSVITNTSPGVWEPPETGGYQRQWYSGDIAIPGATGLSYTTQEGDIGELITIDVIATGDGGPSEPAASNAIGPITEPPPPPDPDPPEEPETLFQRLAQPKAKRSKKR